MKHRSRSFAAVLAVLALLFAQAMASAHACDMDASGTPTTAKVASTQPDADCCDHVAPPPDHSCDNHCQQGNQAPDRAQSTTVTPLVALGFAMPSVVVASAPAPSYPTTAAPDLARDTQPSISVRNCCFGI
jgi:hypothetical protein